MMQVMSIYMKNMENGSMPIWYLRLVKIIIKLLFTDKKLPEFSTKINGGFATGNLEIQDNYNNIYHSN